VAPHRKQAFSFFSIFLILVIAILSVYGTTETRYDKNAQNDTKNYVASYKIDTGSLSSGGVANLQTSDNGYMVFASASSGGQQVLDVEFFGSQSGHLPFIQIPYERKSSPGVSYSYVAAYNWTKGAYESVPTMYTYGSIGTSDATVYIYDILGCSDYVNSTGGWAIEVKAWTTGSPPPSFTLSIDMLYFRVVSYQFSTSQSSSYVGNDAFVDGLSISIDVSVVHSDNTEETIGSKVAAVTGPSSTTNLHNTWNCPATSNVVAVIIRIYKASTIMRTLDYASGGLPFVFISEDLNGNLVAATWTAYYYFYYSSSQDMTFLRFGSSTYNTRILNFQWVQGQSYVENLIDNIQITDSLTKAINKVFAETLTITDSAYASTLAHALVQAIVETLHISDAITKGIIKKLSEILSITDAMSPFKIIIQTFIETMQFTDSIAKGIVKLLTETINISDTLSYLRNFLVTLIDNLSLSDNPLTILGRTLVQILVDALTITDSILTSLGATALILLAVAISALGFALCLFPLTQDDDSAKALAAVTLVLSLAGIAFAVLGYSYALGVGAIGLVLAFASMAMVLATKKD
jgi:hypothetical protein